ncbi:MAG TPA: acyltransferase, partial [Steroidobacter sp.]|uniref:acyltransferase family protein n=1 Tax=Steroidobacter sp. TaxID=1978227 RepID=UPI002EDAC34E
MTWSLLRVKNNYRPDIDGLRAVAVLAVVLYHAFPNQVRGGFAGVDVFFVISGFLISSIIFAEIAEGRFSIASFYVRRVRRIFPALAVCLTFVLVFGFIYLVPFELAQVGKHVFFGASFLSNVALWSESGYFDSEAHFKPLLHLWSLGIEEQFYIVWPALLLIVYQARVKLGRVLGLLLLISFAVNVMLAATDISADFYLPISRFWELLAGAVLAALRWNEPVFRIRSLVSISGLVALLGSFALLSAHIRFPGWFALLPVAGAMALIWAGPEPIANKRILSNRVVVLVGLISYPLYLWHWPLLSFAYIFRGGKPPTPLMAAALVAVSFLLAWVTYRFVESPVRFGRYRRDLTKLAAICVTVLGLAGLTTWIAHGFSGRFPGLDIRKISEAKSDADFKATKGMEVFDHNATLITQIGRGERKVALAGDSLLFHYGPRVQQLADDG